MPKAVSRSAVLDLGSNALRLLIVASAEDSQAYRVIYRARYSLPHPLTSDFLHVLLPQVLTLCREWDVPASQIVILSTEGLRSLNDGDQVFSALQLQFPGLHPPRILSGSEEGQYAAKAVEVRFIEKSTDGILLEMGGGSLQMVDLKEPTKGVSVQAGAARIKVIADESGVDSAEMKVKEYIKDWNREAKPRWFLTGGGFRALGHLLMNLEGDKTAGYPVADVDGYATTAGRLKDLIEKGVVPKGKTFGISKRRKTQLPAVYAVAKAVFAIMNPDDRTKIIFSTSTIADGYLAEVFPLGQMVQEETSHEYNYEEELAKIPRADGVPYWDMTLLSQLSKILQTHAHLPRQVAPAAALHYCLHSGDLSQFTHRDRFSLATALLERYDSKLPPGTPDITEYLDSETVFWSRYFGCVGAVLATLPPGRIKCQVGSSPDESTIFLHFSVPKGIDITDVVEPLQALPKKKSPVKSIEVRVSVYD